MKSTLKRELKGPEIVSREALETSDTRWEFSRGCLISPLRCTSASSACLGVCRIGLDALSQRVGQHQFGAQEEGNALSFPPGEYGRKAKTQRN